MKKILVLEDSIESQNLIHRALYSRYDIQFTNDIKSASQVFFTNTKIWDAIILDRYLPDGDGLMLCSEICKLSSHPPVLIITAKNSIEEKIDGFAAGADDYITKPYDPRELKARLQVAIRNGPQESKSQNTLTADGLTLDLETQSAYFNFLSETETISLTPIEFKILLLLTKNIGNAISRSRFISSIVGKFHYNSRNIDAHICNIRKKLGKSPFHIRYDKAKGYKLVKKKTPRNENLESVIQLPFSIKEPPKNATH